MTSIAIANRYSITSEVLDGYRVRVLSSREAGLRVALAPELGMVIGSLRHQGGELLGLRGGLGAYALRGATMGVPLLYPWANRLSAPEYRLDGHAVQLNGATPLDERGRPIHGLLAAIRGWRPTGAGAGDGGAWAEAELDVATRPDVLAGFPFPHVASVRVTLRGASLTVETTVRATGDEAVPVSFGYHPYLRVPGVPREHWEIEVPVVRRLRVDGCGIPAGGTDPVQWIRGPLGRRSFDDGYVVDAGHPFAVAGGGRRIEVTFDAGYPFAQVFAPCDDDVICFEPMTAPANALRSGSAPAVLPGEEYAARFTITVAA